MDVYINKHRCRGNTKTAADWMKLTKERKEIFVTILVTLIGSRSSANEKTQVKKIFCANICPAEGPQGHWTSTSCSFMSVNCTQLAHVYQSTLIILCSPSTSELFWPKRTQPPTDRISLQLYLKIYSVLRVYFALTILTSEPLN